VSNTKKISITIVVLIVVVWLTYKLRKVLHAMRMKFGMDNFNLNPKKLDKGQWLKSLVDSQGLDTRIGVKISNPSPSTFTISQISADVSTKQGTVLASQDKPLLSPYEIKPNINNVLSIDYFVPLSGIIDLMELKGLSFISVTLALADIAKSYFLTGKLGKTIILDGFAVAEGFKINIDKQTIDI